MVLDVLSLIDNLIQKLLILIRNDISFQQVIRSNQHIIGRIFIQLLPALLLASCNQQHLQQFIQIKSTVNREMHFPLHKVFWGKMHRIHQLTQQFQRIILQLQKIPALQTVKFFAGTVAFQNIQQFFPWDILCRNIQIQKSAGNRYPHRHLYLSEHIHIAESLGTLDFSILQ